jgi:hypothetical protein
MRKRKSRRETKRSDAKIARQRSTTKTQIVVALSASAGITSEAASIVLG